MRLINTKNLLIALAAILVVALGYMAIVTTKRSKSTDQYSMEIEKIEEQSNSDSLESIDKDLQDTDLDTIDKELQDIENELNNGNI